MIKVPTVLILGAGASIPYGFPSGKKLVEKICNMLEDDSNNIYRLFLMLGFSERIVRNFRETLAHSGQSSVDAFLEHRKDFVDVGKVAIATALLPFEKTKKLFDLGMDENWYQYLFSILNTSFQEFGENDLSIITFNYDRSVEHYLFTSLRNTHGKSDKECAEKLNLIPIIHVHGKLGDLEWKPEHRWPVQYDLSDPLDADMVGRASKSIKIIYEDIAEDNEFKQARQLLTKAARIYILGFGFNMTNLKRLGLLDSDFRTVEIQGTAYNLPAQLFTEIKQIKYVESIEDTPPQKKYREKWFGLYEQTVYDFLYKNPNGYLD
ncbi:MAG: hypothetical protein PHY02_00475 [Phycisphaerae bacterium]|nr:hypothetical protein [Phycisphaerae bacterium]